MPSMVVISRSATSADRRHARAPWLAIDMHGAGAALGDAAAELRAGHAEDIADHPEQRHVVGGVDGDLSSIHGEIDHGFLIPFSPTRNPPTAYRSFPAMAHLRQGIGDTPPQDPCWFADQAGLYAEASIRLSAQLVMSAMGH